MSVVSNVEVRLDAKNAIKQFDLLKNKAKEFNRELNGTGPAVTKTSTAVKGLGAALTSALGPLLAVGTAVAAVNKALNTAFARDAAENRLRILTDSAGEYEAALALASQASVRFGLTQTQAATSLGDVYGRLKGLGFGLKETNEIFSGFNVIAKQAGISAEDASGAFIQLGQGLGSGALQGDELRSILERMPQLAQRLAVSMGEPVGRVRELGSEGKITSEVIYKALSEAAQGADALGNALTPQQQAMNSFGRAAEDAFNAFGKLIQPIVVPAIEAASWATQKLAEWYEYIGAKVFPEVVKAFKPLSDALQRAFGDFDLDYIVKIMQGALIQAIKNVLFVVKNLSEVIGFVVNRFKDLADSPIMKALINAVGALVEKLGFANDEVGKFTKEQQEATEEAGKTVDQYSSLPDKVVDVKKKLKEVTSELEKQSLISKSAITGVDRELQLSSVLVDTKKTALSLEIDKAAAAKDYSKVYDLQIKSAKIDYDIAVERIKAEVNKLKLAYEGLKTKEAIVEAAILENEANGKVVSKLEEKLALLKVEVEQAKSSLEFGEKLAEAQIKQAKAVEGAAKEAAKMQQQQSLASEAAAAASRASSLQASSTAVTANNAERTAAAMTRQTKELEKQKATRTQTETFQFSSQLQQLIRGRKQFSNIAEALDFYRDAEKPFIELKQKSESLSQAQDLQAKATQAASLGMNALANQLQRYAEQVARAGNVFAQFKSKQEEESIELGASLTPFAKGGYVKKPTEALIGEAGPEYVIREDQMKEAMVRYASGKRGDDVIPDGAISTSINVKTGPVMQMGGQDYVSRADFEKGLRNVSNSVLATIRRSPNTRSRLGI